MGIWAIPREEDLFPEERDALRMHVAWKRGGSVAKGLLNKAGKKIVKGLPAGSSTSLVGNVYNGIKEGLEETFRAGEHKNFLDAFQNNIKGLRKVIQNFYSLYMLHDGVTTIDAVYTVERDGVEYALAIQKDDQKLSVEDLIQTAVQIKGKEKDHHNSIRKSAIKFPDKNAEAAKIYTELTDGDVHKKGLLDIDTLLPIYQNAEFVFFGLMGKRVEVAVTPDGAKILRYEKPSAGEFLKFYGMMDVLYTAISLGASPAERIFEATKSTVAAKRIYVTEAIESARITMERYGDVRKDGRINPLSAVYRPPSGIYRQAA
jgi:hypothetical protein